MVYGVCRLVLRDADEAEDAAQQVFLSAYRALLAGTEPRNAGAWLGTIARNEARGRLATRSQRPLLLDDRDEAASSSLEEQADARADLAALRTQIAALPGKQRDAVVLRDIYGLRYDEVARALNTSRPAVEALLFRGRRRLQRRLRPGLAAGVLVVPLALRESLAYAVPGFAGGASTVGMLGKLAAVPVAAKLAAAGVTVGAVGSVGLVADGDLRRPRPPAPAVVTVVAVDEAPHARAAAGSPASPPPVRAVSAVPASRKVDSDGDDARADEPDELEDETVEEDRDERDENDRGGDRSGPGRGHGDDDRDEDDGDVAARHDDDDEADSVDELDADDDGHGGGSGPGGEGSGHDDSDSADDED